MSVTGAVAEFLAEPVTRAVSVFLAESVTAGEVDGVVDTGAVR